MKLLVSVMDADEASAAAAAGADIIDVKNPAEGSLGAPSPDVIAAVRAAVAPELPVSAAIGDMPNLPGTAALAALGAARSGATFVKLGLWGVSTEDEAVALLRAVRAASRVPGTVVVAAAYADARRVAHAPLAPELLPRVAHAAGIGVCLLDTAVKDGRGLLEWQSPDALTALVAEAHAAGLEMALAGALRAEDLPVVLAHRRRHRRRPLGRLRRRQALGTARPGAGPCAAQCVRYAAAGALISPAACRRWAHLRALRSRVAAGTASPQAAAASVACSSRSSRTSARGLGLDQAAQAEADVPAFVALDPRDALAHAGQGAVVEVVEQRVLPGVEDDPLEQHVVEADALAESGAARGELRGHRRQPLLEELEQRGRGVVPGRGAPLGRRSAPGSSSTSAPIRSKSRAWRCSSRRWRKKTQAIRLSCEISFDPRAASANGVRCSATASSATQKPASSVVRRARRSSGRSGHARASGVRSIAAGFHCRRATIREKKLGQKLRLASTKWPPTTRSHSGSAMAPR